jgi:hypothetical protein
MNDHKIDFIIAYNDERVFGECVYYLDKLTVPEGYEVGLLAVKDGKSITSAYNEGIAASQAKYKVYLHQDVFIFNRQFIPDILEIFQSNSEIGMIGLFGGTQLPSNGFYSNVWNVGWARVDNAFNVMEMNWNPPEPGVSVGAIDGMIMITQYDLPWREDLFTGWDFYDASQSHEFRDKGYHIVVPHQKEAWCLHDCGVSKLQNYEESRLKFVKEYIKDYGEAELARCWDYQEEMVKQLAETKERLAGLFAERKFAEINTELQTLTQDDSNDSELRVMKRVFEIYRMENEDAERDYVPFVESFSTWGEIFALYREVKYMLRRIEQGHTGDEQVGELVRMFREKRLSHWALTAIANWTTFAPNKVVSFVCGQLV